MPSLVAEANVWIDAGSIHTLWPAYSNTAINAGPALNALAALAIVAIILQEALLKVIEAGRILD